MILPVTERSRVAEARRLGMELASKQGLGAADASRVAIVATELATNLIKHAGCGEIAISVFADGDGSGVELLALDRGPGIADLQKSLADGHSTTGSAGSGLGAVQRNSDVFAVSSRIGGGTAILARIRPTGQYPARSGYIVSALCSPYPGESVCGDDWAVKATGSGLLVLLADGSGQGPMAQMAATRAREVFFAWSEGTVEQIAEAVHRALGATRGAAIAVAEIDPLGGATQGRVNFVGIGNISAALVEGRSVQRMISHNGTAGHVAPRIRMFQYPFSELPTIIMHSDGLTARWNLDDYPGLTRAHPSLLAGILYRDYRRGRDDAGIVVVRNNSLCPTAS
jgi:anti-sigma regulatory factor (Ser/Thr protein kinase)